jgi:tRNA pseudouridine13 synthase
MTTEWNHIEAVDRADAAVCMLAALPFVSDPLPGIGGTIKAAPEHFVVEEVLPYAAGGAGEHVYVTFRRTGTNTVDAARILQHRLGLAASDVGWGGRKDKTAVVVQTISLRCALDRPLAEIKSELDQLPFEILEIKRHGNKIKTGHVAANRFDIIVSGIDAEALPRALAIAERLQQTGIPNFYGPQRFGVAMRNVQRGFDLFRKKGPLRKDAFMVSVVQAALFNIWLDRRIQDGNFGRLLTGDIVKKTDTGGMFSVDDVATESARFAAGQIIYTGPMYGYKMKAAQDTAGQQEAALLDQFGLTAEDFRRLRSPGARREALLRPTDLDISAVDDGLRFTFTLPSGAYATTLLREFIKSA